MGADSCCDCPSRRLQRRPQLPAPAHADIGEFQHLAGYPAVRAPNAKTVVSTRSAPLIDLAHWWQALHDPELDSLLDRAVAGNLDMQVAIDRLQQSRALLAEFTGQSLPDLDLSGVGGGEPVPTSAVADWSTAPSRPPSTPPACAKSPRSSASIPISSSTSSATSAASSRPSPPTRPPQRKCATRSS